MAIDYALLASTVVTSFLMPYVKLGVEKIAEGVTENIGKATADQVTELTKSIWNRVKSAFSSDDDKTTFSQFEKRPDAAKTLLEEILREKLEQDKPFAEELFKQINATDSNGNTGAQIMNAGIAGILDARGANFSGASGVNLTAVNIGNPILDINSSKENE